MNSTKFAIKSRNFIAAAAMGAVCHSVNAEIVAFPTEGRTAGTTLSSLHKVDDQYKGLICRNQLSLRNSPQPAEISVSERPGLSIISQPASSPGTGLSLSDCAQ